MKRRRLPACGQLVRTNPERRCGRVARRARNLRGFAETGTAVGCYGVAGRETGPTFCGAVYPRGTFGAGIGARLAHIGVSPRRTAAETKRRATRRFKAKFEAAV